jgi:DNA-binding SARP family transcriptional activator
LGELEVRRGGSVLALPASRRTRALLGYLVATGRPHLRSQLCDLLWPSPDDPRASLRWSLAKLRPLLDEPGATRLVADRDRVAFEPAGAWVDLFAVRAAITEGTSPPTMNVLESAAALFRGELLDGLELPESYRFHEWCVAEREAARRLQVSILEALAARLPDPESALAHARTWVGVDPLAEAAHGAVIRLLGALGRVREALRQYETCRRLLRHELGREPSVELERIRRTLGVGSPRATAADATPATTAPSVPPAGPFVGRQREMAALRDWLGAGPPSSVALVLGEAGIGKTRLLAELAVEARSGAGRVLAGRAYEAEVVRPYGAWIDALRSLPREVAAAASHPELGALLPELGPPPAEFERSRLFDAVVGLLGRLAEGDRAVVVVLDDVQWLDEASAALLHYVARSVGGRPVRIACAARPGELEDAPAVRRALRALSREGRLTSLELKGLGQQETTELVRGLGAGVDAGRVFAESAGHPLFALEIARALAQGRETLSESLAGLIDERLARVGEPARELVGWAAALGPRCDLDTLAEVAQIDAADAVRAVEEMGRHRLVRAVESGGSDYEFTHDLLNRGAYRSLSAARRRLIHARIARVLAARPDADGALASDVAYHASLGGEDELAASACARAGKRCLRVFAYAEAAELAARGLPHVGKLPQETRLNLQVRLLRLYVHSGMSRERAAKVEAELRGIVSEAESAGLHDVAQAAFEVLTFVDWYTGQFALAHQDTLRAAELGRAGDPVAAAQALAASARCLAHLDRDLPRADTLLREARALAGPSASALVEIDWGRGLVRLHEGDYDEAVALLERALDQARRAGGRYPEWDCQTRLVMIELERGRPAAALERCRGLAEMVGQMGEGSEPYFTVALEALARARVEGEGARAALAAALARLREIDSKWMLAYVLTLSAADDLALGRSDAAEGKAVEALTAAEAVGRRSEAALARAILMRVACLRGDRDAGRAHLAALRADLEARGVLSARARQAVSAAAAALGESIPTPAPTVTPTVPT